MRGAGLPALCALKRIAKTGFADLMPGMGREVRLRYDPDEAVTVCTRSQSQDRPTAPE
jgi:hypothetical protein